MQRGVQASHAAAPLQPLRREEVQGVGQVSYRQSEESISGRLKRCDEHPEEFLPCGWCRLHRKVQYLAILGIAACTISMLQYLMQGVQP